METIRWDPALPYDRSGVRVNRGCPDGYFAQFVAPGEPDSITGPQGIASNDGTVVIHAGNAVRCRLLATSTPDTIQAESGISRSEAAKVYTDAVADTVHQAGSVVVSGLGPFLPWIMIGIGAWFLLPMLRPSARRSGWNPGRRRFSSPPPWHVEQSMYAADEGRSALQYYNRVGHLPMGLSVRARVWLRRHLVIRGRRADLAVRGE